MEKEISQKEIDRLYNKIKKDTEAYGYHLNPDEQFTKDLIRGLLVNESRYGYQSCPCRLSYGDIEKDRDIICPCDYRDPDLNDYGACYCGLYVSEEIVKGKKKLTSIPERRYMDKDKFKDVISGSHNAASVLLKTFEESVRIPVWRCRVCGYLCAREQPPEVCPICKVNKDRFERFL
jgi:ferredoxin-thioredoxin reductase catalytic subunit/rubredoxin